MEQSMRPVSLVTGDSRGTGAATVCALAERGYHVAIACRTVAARAKQVAAEVVERGGRAFAFARSRSPAI